MSVGVTSHTGTAGRFAGRVAIVTGSSRGIGLATARRFVDGGGRACLTGRKAEPLALAAQELGGPEVALWVAGSADDPDHQTHTVDTVRDRFGPIDILVNNTGVNPSFSRIDEISPDVAAAILKTNVVSAIGWTQRVLAAGLADRGGAIVNVASVAGLKPAGRIGVYGSSKAALIHLTEQLALELAPRVRVNAVAPAVVRTRFAAPLYQDGDQELAATYPLGRLGEPDDVAAAIAFLVSDESAWITGHTLTVDGGLTLTGGV